MLQILWFSCIYVFSKQYKVIKYCYHRYLIKLLNVNHIYTWRTSNFNCEKKNLQVNLRCKYRNSENHSWCSFQASLSYVNDFRDKQWCMKTTRIAHTFALHNTNEQFRWSIVLQKQPWRNVDTEPSHYNSSYNFDKLQNLSGDHFKKLKFNESVI